MLVKWNSKREWGDFKRLKEVGGWMLDAECWVLDAGWCSRNALLVLRTKNGAWWFEWAGLGEAKENDCAQASSVARMRSAGRAGLTVKARTKQRANLVFTFLSFFSFWICCLFLLLFYLQNGPHIDKLIKRGHPEEEIFKTENCGMRECWLRRLQLQINQYDHVHCVADLSRP